MREGKPVQKLHGDKRFATLPANVVNGANIGMVQRGRSSGFELKTGERVRITGNLLGQELKGDEAMQSRVFSLVHHTHPATTEFVDDVVVRDGSPDHTCPI